MTTMHAWRLEGPGDPDAFEMVARLVPDAIPGHVVLRIAAFGLNRSEYFSRRGLSSPDFSYPRVLGLECVGIVQDPGQTDLLVGERVMALMGGMGRSYDGSYATHTLVPRSQVFRIGQATAGPAHWGAIPETYNTAWGVCIEALDLQPGQTVLIRGGTSALGMAAASLAHWRGCSVASTTRNPDKLERLKAMSHVAHVILDREDLPQQVMATMGGPVDAVVECVGSKKTVESSAQSLKPGGRLGMVGQLAETWDTDAPLELPDHLERSFTRSDLVASPKDEERMRAIVAAAEAGHIAPNIHRVFGFDELPEAHRVMGANEAVGKLVVQVCDDW